MQKPKLNKDILELIKQYDSMRTEVLKISAGRLVLSGVSSDALAKNSYQICSSCYSVIDRTWDHDDWCELYEEEKLSEWIRKGKNEK